MQGRLSGLRFTILAHHNATTCVLSVLGCFRFSSMLFPRDSKEHSRIRGIRVYLPQTRVKFKTPTPKTSRNLGLSATRSNNCAQQCGILQRWLWSYKPHFIFVRWSFLCLPWYGRIVAVCMIYNQAYPGVAVCRSLGSTFELSQRVSLGIIDSSAYSTFDPINEG